ncbi:hypothetical protein [Silvanigrella sp.]|jgi:long-chain fatty acid transport protein|uniref:hypothetical protein n=1 Tax=Silvanigrella sp. TaxID=2024976 RepID=UPI0037CC2683
MEIYINKKQNKIYLYHIIKMNLFIFVSLFSFQSYGDWWHNHSFLMASRPAGMGGAYTGIGSGPAGVFYNPGGIAFSPDASISVSTTNYYTSTITQDGYLANDNTSFSLTDADLLSGYFGGSFRLGTDLPIYMAFAIYNKDYVNIDNVVESDSKNGLTKTRFVQKVSSTENEYAMAVSFRTHDKFSFGLSIAFFDMRYSELQGANILSGPYDDPYGGAQIYQYELWNYTSNFYVRGIEAGLGFLYKPKEYISFGLSGKYKFILSQNAEGTYVDNQVVTDSQFNPINNSNDYSDFYEQYINQTNIKHTPEPFGQLPYIIRFGIAWMPSDWQTFTSDLIYTSENNAVNPFYHTKKTYDYAFGSETIFYDTLGIRLGFFTNRWSGDPNVTDQFVNVNFLGYTAAIVYYNKRSVYSLTYMLQESQPGAEYSLEPVLYNGRNNPKVYWRTDQIALGITGEL